MANKPPVDWEAIEGSYRAGSPSVVAIAEKHGITEGAIRKRAKKEGWTRDLSGKVQAATKEKLVRKSVRDGGTIRTDDEIVEDESTQRVDIVLAHRQDLSQWRGIATKLMNALGDMEVDASNHNDFARSLNAGVDAQLKVIKGERQAYNLDDVQGDKDTGALSDLMDALSQEA